jgi:hypothetical protein
VTLAPDMELATAILSFVAAAVAVWLSVRLVNRRHWANLSWMVGAALAYPVMMGPLCWLSSRFGYGASTLAFIYRPVILISFDKRCPSAIRDAVDWYSELGADSSWHWRFWRWNGIHISWESEESFYVE